MKGKQKTSENYFHPWVTGFEDPFFFLSTNKATQRLQKTKFFLYSPDETQHAKDQGLLIRGGRDGADLNDRRGARVRRSAHLLQALSFKRSGRGKERATTSQ